MPSGRSLTNCVASATLNDLKIAPVDEFFLCRFFPHKPGISVNAILDRHKPVPLPPYVVQSASI